MTGLFGSYYLRDALKTPAGSQTSQWPVLLGTGFVTNFLDTLGVGSFAPQTALIRFFRLTDDRMIPGTLNVGNTFATVLQAFLFMKAVPVEPLTLISLSVAAPMGALLGAGIVVKLSRKSLRFWMGLGMMLVALFILAGLLHLLPLGGESTGLQGWKLAVALLMSLLFGALQTIGIGFYAPCMAMVFAFGMDPRTAFPIMMTATAMLMAAGASRFIREARYDKRVALALSFSGMVGVLLAAYVVKTMPLQMIKWLVFGVVGYTSVSMLVASGTREPESVVP
ncbi:MAG: sulfite exporter TauE/SafE family protein [Marinilabiliales bacterium]|nr:sulfite exporter TauE/SafE family protein [Marinilabiliales bacterium]